MFSFVDVVVHGSSYLSFFFRVKTQSYRMEFGSILEWKVEMNAVFNVYWQLTWIWSFYLLLCFFSVWMVGSLETLSCNFLVTVFLSPNNNFWSWIVHLYIYIIQIDRIDGWYNGIKVILCLNCEMVVVFV